MAGQTLSQETLDKYQEKACSTCAYSKHTDTTGVGVCSHQRGVAECLGSDNGQYRLWGSAVHNSTPHYANAPEPVHEVKPDSGAHASYYEVQILLAHKGVPYRAECQDIIEALGMDFNEGNAFKALWRRAAARMGKVKKGNESPLYDAQKIAFYGNRILQKEEQNG